MEKDNSSSEDDSESDFTDAEWGVAEASDDLSESNYDEFEILHEHPNGNEQEHSATNTLDNYEDKQNPAYVPRLGLFYWHDLRNEDFDENAENERKFEKTRWMDDKRWLHDKFDIVMQTSKSREELIAEYGYDIRARDHPPEKPPRKNNSEKPREPRNNDYIQRGFGSQQQLAASELRRPGLSNRPRDKKFRNSYPSDDQQREQCSSSKRRNGWEPRYSHAFEDEQLERHRNDQHRVDWQRESRYMHLPANEQNERNCNYNYRNNSCHLCALADQQCNQHTHGCPIQGPKVQVQERTCRHSLSGIQSKGSLYKSFPESTYERQRPYCSMDRMPQKSRGSISDSEYGNGLRHQFEVRTSQQWINSKYSQGDYKLWNSPRAKMQQLSPRHDDADARELAKEMDKIFVKDENNNMPSTGGILHNDKMQRTYSEAGVEQQMSERDCKRWGQQELDGQVIHSESQAHTKQQALSVQQMNLKQHLEQQMHSKLLPCTDKQTVLEQPMHLKQLTLADQQMHIRQQAGLGQQQTVLDQHSGLLTNQQQLTRFEKQTHLEQKVELQELSAGKVYVDQQVRLEQLTRSGQPTRGGKRYSYLRQRAPVEAGSSSTLLSSPLSQQSTLALASSFLPAGWNKPLYPSGVRNAFLPEHQLPESNNNTCFSSQLTNTSASTLYTMPDRAESASPVLLMPVHSTASHMASALTTTLANPTSLTSSLWNPQVQPILSHSATRLGSAPMTASLTMPVWSYQIQPVHSTANVSSANLTTLSLWNYQVQPVSSHPTACIGSAALTTLANSASSTSVWSNQVLLPPIHVPPPPPPFLREQSFIEQMVPEYGGSAYFNPRGDNAWAQLQQVSHHANMLPSVIGSQLQENDRQRVTSA